MRICLMCRKRNIDYYGICPECREFSDSKRSETVDLSGMTAVITGGRIKIGYAVCLRLLRQGARVIAVTRYPKSALEQYMKEPDFRDFSGRLSVIGFDLMRIDRISELADCIRDISDGRVDILVNNAAQTVKKSKDYYAAAIAHESELTIETDSLYPVIAPEKYDGFGLIPQNMLVDYGAFYYLTPEEKSIKARGLIKKERDYLSSGLKRLGFRVFESTGNFILFKAAQGALAGEGDLSPGKSSLYHQLKAKYKILIRQCGDFEGLSTEYYRVCIKNHRENRHLLHSIKKNLENQDKSGGKNGRN